MFSFRIGRIPVRAHVSFLLLAAFIATSPHDGADPRALLARVAIVVAGVLLHELGHALVGMTFGLSPRIDLVGLGGVTTWEDGKATRLGPARRIAISVAGPAVGLTIGVAAWLWERANVASLSSTASDLVAWTIWVNAGWGLLNLLPILPMDGGNVLLQVLHAVTRGRGAPAAHVVSIALAVALGAAGVAYGQYYLAMLLGMFVLANVRALRARGDQKRDEPLAADLRAGFDAIARGDTGEAARRARDVLAAARTNPTRVDAVRLLAFAHLYSGAWGPLVDLMESPASAAIADDELAKFEHAARELGRPEEAERIAAVRARRQAPAL